MRKQSAGITMAAGIVILLGGCSSDGSEATDPGASQAQQLVSATQAAGVAPNLTVGVAESLYGTAAPQICDALSDGLGSAEELILKGNPSGRRAKLITSDAVTYGGLVVQVYCPDQAATYAALVARSTRPTPAADQPYRHLPASSRQRIDAEMSHARLRAAPAKGPTGTAAAIAMIAWPALAMMMVASVGSIAQLSDSATFGLGAMTVYLSPPCCSCCRSASCPPSWPPAMKAGSSSGCGRRSATGRGSRPPGSCS